MKIFNRFSKVAFLVLTLSTAVFTTTVNADVIQFVENKNIGLVVAHSVSPDGKYVFSTTISPDFLFVHKRDPKTGKILEEIQKLEAKDFNSEVAEPSFSPESMVVSPDSKQLYIAASFGDPGNSALNYAPSVIRFDIGASGELTYHNRVVVTGNSDGLTISKSGKFMFVGDGINGNVLSSILRAPNGDITTAHIRVPTPAEGAGGAGAFSISPDEKNLYGSSTYSDGHLHVYNINQNDGTLTLVQSFIPNNKADEKIAGDIVGPGSGGTGSAVSQDGKFFYTAGGYDDYQDSIAIFKRNTNGTLNFIKNVKAPSLANSNTQPIIGSSKVLLTISKNQKYIYAFDDNYEGFIGVWERNQNTGDLNFLGLVKGEGLRDGAGESFVLSKDGSTLNINVGKGISVYDLRADLSLVKSDGTDPVNASGTIDYTLAVTNEKGADAQNVVITDTLPAGTSFVSGTVNSNTGSCSASGQTVTCTMGQVLSGDSYNAALKVTAPATQGQITNTATVKSDQLDTNMANNTDTETTNIGSGGTSTGGGNSSGGGSMPLGVLVLLSLMFIRRIVYCSN